ncbi:MAG: alpha-glucuronidase [Chitinophagales bacterium]|nr:alpha-glucuronidase [Chitinophagales bacterium]
MRSNMPKQAYYIGLSFLLLFTLPLRAETGYDLWLRYNKVSDPVLLKHYRQYIEDPVFPGSSPMLDVAKAELRNAFTGLLGTTVSLRTTPTSRSTFFVQLNKTAEPGLGEEGFGITSKGGKIVVRANTEKGILYGSFHFLRLLQTNQRIDKLSILSTPRLKLRMLNHWDNLNRTVERGYAGFSLWDWHRLPGYLDPRYIDYARANASIGINAVSLTNVNANATVLSPSYLLKVKALADLFRPYGIKVFLTARFSAPIELGKLKTADPLDPGVKQWWTEKAREIYALIPDFGGFLVKANSEGQPGPQDYKRNHAEGANMLAEALAPHNGIVIWRAFVYAAENPVDRHKQAYDDFVPLDGKFLPNVMVQVKNGAIDFMPREPFHPLFGAMPNTPLMMEFQVTQEYLGQATNWVYLGPLFKEVLDADTHQQGKGSTVAKVIDGSLEGHTLTGMTGVSNIGNDINWCGHPMAQANWYALGRLAWDHQLSPDSIAGEWIRMSFSNDPKLVKTIRGIMGRTREIMVNYMNPLGLHHIMGTGHHYGPAPWVSNQSRPEWNPVYYHKADSIGIGFNRTATGSNALEQYHPGARKAWEDKATCELPYLLWFHHVGWKERLVTGRTLWDELCYRYYGGADSVQWIMREWNALEGKVDKERFSQVKQLLKVQWEEAVWWREACLLYFQTFSREPIPASYPQPVKSLDYYKSLRFPFAPGNG